MKTRLYTVWIDMRQRCSNPNRKEYARYGGRGITVCEGWDKYEEFRAWAMESGYSDNLTLERVNNNGPYCPENCRWATRKEQANNRVTNRLLTMNGETHTMTEWAEVTGISRETIQRRLQRGWTVEKALTVPVHRR